MHVCSYFIALNVFFVTGISYCFSVIILLSIYLFVRLFIYYFVILSSVILILFGIVGAKHRAAVFVAFGASYDHCYFISILYPIFCM